MFKIEMRIIRILFLFLIQAAIINCYGQSLVLEFNYPLELQGKTFHNFVNRNYDEITITCNYYDENCIYNASETFIVSDYKKINLSFQFKRPKQVKIEINGATIEFKINLILYPEKELTVKTNNLIKCVTDCPNMDYFNAKYTFAGHNSEVNRYHAYYYSKYADNVMTDYDHYGKKYSLTNDDLRSIYINDAREELKERKQIINNLIPNTAVGFLELKKLLNDNCNYTTGIEVLDVITSYKIDTIQYLDLVNSFNKLETQDIYIPAFIRYCNKIKNYFYSDNSFDEYQYFQTFVNQGKFKASKSWEKEYLLWFKNKKSTDKWDFSHFDKLFKDQKILIDIKNDFYVNFKLSEKYGMDSLYIKKLVESATDKNIIYHKLINRLRESYNLKNYQGVSGVPYYPYYFIENQFMPPWHLSLFYKYIDSAHLQYVQDITENYRKQISYKAEVEAYCNKIKKQDIIDSNFKVQNIIKKHKGKIIICQLWGDYFKDYDVMYLEHIIKKYKNENVVFINFCDYGRNEQMRHYEEYLVWLKERHLDSFCHNYLVKRNVCFSIIHPTNYHSILIFDKQGKFVPLSERFVYASMDEKEAYELSNLWLKEYIKNFNNKKETEPEYEDTYGGDLPIDFYDVKPIANDPTTYQNRIKRERDSLHAIELAKPKWEELPYNAPEVLNMSFSSEIDSVIKGRIKAPILNANWIKEELFKNKGWYVIEELGNDCIFLSKNNFKTQFSEEPYKWIMSENKTICYSIKENKFPVKINLTYNPKNNFLTINGVNYYLFYQDSNLITLLRQKK